MLPLPDVFLIEDGLVFLDSLRRIVLLVFELLAGKLLGSLPSNPRLLEQTVDSIRVLDLLLLEQHLVVEEVADVVFV